MTDILAGTIDNKFINDTETLGKLLEIKTPSRPYDTIITLYFERPTGKPLEFDTTFGMTEAYVEYEIDIEEKSKQRIHERTAELKLEIIGNDWALRPENVVATQGIDIHTYNTI